MTRTQLLIGCAALLVGSGTLATLGRGQPQRPADPLGKCDGGAQKFDEDCAALVAQVSAKSVSWIQTRLESNVLMDVVTGEANKVRGSTAGHEVKALSKELSRAVRKTFCKDPDPTPHALGRVVGSIIAAKGYRSSCQQDMLIVSLFVAELKRDGAEPCQRSSTAP